MPAHGTADEALLFFCENARRIFVTQDRASLAAHIRNHIDTGHILWGVFVLPRRITLTPLSITKKAPAVS